MIIKGNVSQTQLPAEQKVKTQPQTTEPKDNVEIGTNTEKNDFVLTPAQKQELKEIAKEMGINLGQEGVTLTEEQKKELVNKALSEIDKAAKVGIATISVVKGGFSGIRGLACGLVGLGAAAIGAKVGAGAIGGPIGVAVAALAMGGYGVYRELNPKKGILAEFKEHYFGNLSKQTPEEKVKNAVIRGVTDAAATALGGLVPYGAITLAPLATGAPAGIKTAVNLSHGLDHLQEAIINELNTPEGQEAQNQILNEINNQLKTE